MRYLTCCSCDGIRSLSDAVYKAVLFGDQRAVSPAKKMHANNTCTAKTTYPGKQTANSQQRDLHCFSTYCQNLLKWLKWKQVELWETDCRRRDSQLEVGGNKSPQLMRTLMTHRPCWWMTGMKRKGEWVKRPSWEINQSRIIRKLLIRH